MPSSEFKTDGLLVQARDNGGYGDVRIETQAHDFTVFVTTLPRGDTDKDVAVCVNGDWWVKRDA